MSNPTYQILTNTLKELLKKQRINYKELAEKLSISQSTLKKYLIAKDGNVGRLAEICKVLDISFYDMVEFSKIRKPTKYYYFNEEQEKFFSKNIHYYHFLVKLHHGLSPDEIQNNFRLSDISIQKYLLKLERMELIEVNPGNKVKNLLGSGFRFKEGGKLEKEIISKYSRIIDSHFKKVDLSKDSTNPDRLKLVFGKLSKETAHEFRSRMVQLHNELVERIRHESKFVDSKTTIYANLHQTYSEFNIAEKVEVILNID